ncbi:MAG TPA: cytochrome c biogenesis protein CcdA [Clostridiales bacterium]|nr:MAG: cytochrome c biogenesis protein CcdA [Clostridiales bacterium GWD2_32_59]HAN10688.1 cytochrome c biogenesis protein CcdA [Clostridiales bacterium]
MDDISFLLAFSAGFLSFLSPCILPLIPGYISYLTGTNVSNNNTYPEKLTIIRKSLGFILGFTIIFFIMGLTISSLGKLFIDNQLTFRKVAGIIIILLGLHTIGILKFKSLYIEKRFIKLNTTTKNLSSVLIGMAFAAGWTPCIGPILSSILIYAGSMDTLEKGTALLFFYSLGLAIPFLLTALAINNFSKYFARFSRFMPIVSIVSGLLIITMGILVFTNNLTILSRYLDFINFY